MEDNRKGAGLTLLREILEVGPGGRVFTSEEAIEGGDRLGLSRSHTYKLLSELTRQGLLHRPRGRLYVMQPPMGGIIPVRSIAVAVRAVRPSAVGGETALLHWGLIAQIPLREETVATPARIQWRHGVRADAKDRIWKVEGGTVRFQHVSMNEMFGIETVRLDSETVVPMFNRERMVADMLVKTPDGKSWITEVKASLGEDFNPRRLVSYATRLNVRAKLGNDLDALIRNGASGNRR